MLQKLKAQLKAPQSRPYYIFDGAANEDLYALASAYAKKHKLVWHNLHSDTIECADLATSPYLLGLSEQAQGELLPQLTAPEYAPHGIILWSSIQPVALWKKLQYHTRVHLDGQENIILRIVYPVVFPSILNTLWSSVGNSLTTPLNAWCLTNLDSAWYMAQRNPSAEPATESDKVIFMDKAQKQPFSKATMGMRVYMEICNKNGKEPPVGQSAKSLKQIQGQLARAENRGAKDDGDYFFFCFMADSVDPEFDSFPKIKKR